MNKPMSNANDIMIDPASPTPDRMEQHHRQQLSAMADGALSPDQARFLLRRLQHDGELAACWERWQVYGDAMRGHAHALLPADFAERVGRALHEAPPAEAVATVAAPRRGQALRWAGGGALAASVALVALFGLRPGGIDAPPPAEPQPLAEAAPAGGVEPPLQTPATPAAMQHVGDDQGSAAMATAAVAAAAIATAPAAAAAGERRQVRTTTVTRAAPATRVAAAPVRSGSAAVPDLLEAVHAASGQGASQHAVSSTQTAAQQVASQAAPRDPFSAPATPRPWPRAVLPGANQGAFNASYGGPVFAPYPPLRTLPAEAAPAVTVESDR